MDNCNTVINKYDAISFDIFDTLIKRIVATPHDVFLLMERYCFENGIQLPDDFKTKRIMAERTINSQNGHPSTITEIYEYFCKHFGGNANELKEIEEQIELAVCKPNPAIVDLFNDCICKRKRVFIISDMYLDSYFLEKILKNCGIIGYEKIYVSCEYRATKSTGKLFKIALNEVGVTPRKWIHIGDNPKGDIRSPKRIGISSYLIQRDKQMKYRIKADVKECIDFIMMNRCVDIVKDSMKKNEILGARILGPLLVGFSKWMAFHLNTMEINKIFFLSRDGYTMKKAFDAMYPGEFETSYIYASRRSWTVPAIWMEPEYEDILKNISMSPKTSVERFLTRIGLCPDECKKEIESSGLKKDTVIDRKLLPKSKEFKALYLTVREKVIKNSKNEYAALTEYLKQEGVKDKIAIVDIGYSGTMQKALQMILDSMGVKYELQGLYMGLNSKSSIINNHEINANGFLYGPRCGNDYQKKISAFISVFESIFLAQEGSTYRFVMRNGFATPELYEYEYANKKESYVDETSRIIEFQNGAQKYVQYVSETAREGILNIDSNLAINNLLCMGLKPEKAGVDLFADFRVFDTCISHIAHPNSISRYTLHPVNLKNDFFDSTWKIAFLYRLIRIPLPYEEIYYALKKIHNI